MRCAGNRHHLRAVSNEALEARREGIDDSADAVLEAEEKTPACATRAARLGIACACGCAQAANHTAITPLHLDEPRHRCAEAEQIRIGCIDAAGERLRDA